MYFKRLLTQVILLMVFLTAVAITVYAEGNFSDDYPGVGENITIHMADAQVGQAARCYYKVYGSFPDRWSDLEESGISDLVLVGFQMQPIDPGDARLDFPGDVYYENNLGRATVHKMGHKGKQTRQVLDPARTYGEVLAQLEESYELSPEQEARIDEILDDENQLKQFAMLGLFSRALVHFQTVHERFPASLEEFFESGLSPISERTKNPVTGVPFKFDASPGDVFLEFKENNVFMLHVDEKEVRLPQFDYYF